MVEGAGDRSGFDVRSDPLAGPPRRLGQVVRRRLPAGIVARTWSSWVRAGALAARGLGSHTATLRVVGVDGYDRRDAIHISTRAQRSARSVSGGYPSVLVHRSASLDLAGGRLVDGIPVTGLARAVLDTAAIVDDSELELGARQLLQSAGRPATRRIGPR